MVLTYSLNDDDYLQHQLYIASKTERIRKKRRKSWLFATLSVFCLFLISFQIHSEWVMYTLGGWGIITVIFYPIYLRNHYYKHYEKYIKDTYKNRFSEPCTLTFNETNIETFDKTGESKINLSIIEEIVETANYIYLRFSTGESLIIPKLKIENLSSVLIFLKALAVNMKIKYSEELNWRWK